MKLLAFLKLIRYQNLLIILVTQAFAFYFLDVQTKVNDLLDMSFIFICIITFLAASAGYIINDYMDVYLDLVNKPEKVIVGNIISRRWAMFLHLVLNIVALSMAWSLNKNVFLLTFICIALLWLYSQFLKKTYLAGNLVVAFLTSFTIFILYFINQNLNSNAIITYAVFAFFTTLIREIIKDTEDLRGDELFKAKTLPIVLGVRRTKNVLFYLQLTLVALTFMLNGLFGALSDASSKINFLFSIYTTFFVLVPMIFIIWLIKTADTKADFSRLSLYSKLIMITGIISMFFWKF